MLLRAVTGRLVGRQVHIRTPGFVAKLVHKGDTLLRFGLIT